MPRQDSTGGKQKLGPISKQGDRYLRRILVVGACSVLWRARQQPEKYPWLMQLLARRPFKVVAVALANKMARVAWSLLANADGSGIFDGDAHALMCTIYKNEHFPIEIRIDCAKAAIRFEKPALESVDSTVKDHRHYIVRMPEPVESLAAWKELYDDRRDAEKDEARLTVRREQHTGRVACGTDKKETKQ